MDAAWRISASRIGCAQVRTETVGALKRDGLAVEIVSGDREMPVRALAAGMGVPYFAGVLPGGKAAHVAELSSLPARRC